jgi:hypothetical protein
MWSLFPKARPNKCKQNLDSNYDTTNETSKYILVFLSISLVIEVALISFRWYS